MNEQLGTNWVTWFVLFPILVLAASIIIWLMIKAHVTLWKRIGFIAMGLFAFLGFAFVVLGIYYRTNKPFSAGLKTYAYTVLAPDYAYSSYAPNDHDPFQLSEQGYGPALMLLEVHKQDGQLRILRIPPSNTTFGAQLFTPGKWTAVNVDTNNNNAITVSDVGDSITKTSLWWALTKDVFRLNAKLN